jgi:hypothetical protein
VDYSWRGQTSERRYWNAERVILEPRTDDPGELVQVFGAARHVEQILIFVIVCAWIFGMAYAVVWNYLYFTKVLPTLSRDGLDDWPKFMPLRLVAQVDLFLTRLPPTAPRPWYYGVLSRVRAINAAILVVGLVVFMAWVAFLSL